MDMELHSPNNGPILHDMLLSSRRSQSEREESGRVVEQKKEAKSNLLQLQATRLRDATQRLEDLRNELNGNSKEAQAQRVVLLKGLKKSLEETLPKLEEKQKLVSYVDNRIRKLRAQTQSSMQQYGQVCH